MRAALDPGAELGGVVEVRERPPLRDGHPEERAERAPALADLVDQEAVRGHVPAHLLVVPVEDVDGEGPVLEPAPEQPVPEPVEHPLEDEHPGTEQEGPLRERVAGEEDGLAHTVIPALGIAHREDDFALG